MPSNDYGYSEEAYEEAVSAGGGGGKFLKMEPGYTPVITIVGKRFMEKLLWTGGTPAYVPWEDELYKGKMNPRDGKPYRAAHQITFNVYDHDTKQVRILQGMQSLVIEYQNKLETYGRDTDEIGLNEKPLRSLDHRAFKAEKIGKGKDTRWSLNLWPDVDLPVIGDLELYDLSLYSNAAKQETQSAPSQQIAAGGDSDLPF